MFIDIAYNMMSLLKSPSTSVIETVEVQKQIYSITKCRFLTPNSQTRHIRVWTKTITRFSVFWSSLGIKMNCTWIEWPPIVPAEIAYFRPMLIQCRILDHGVCS